MKNATGPKTPFGFPEGVNRAVSLIYADILSTPSPLSKRLKVEWISERHHSS